MSGQRRLFNEQSIISYVQSCTGKVPKGPEKSTSLTLRERDREREIQEGERERDVGVTCVCVGVCVVRLS